MPESAKAATVAATEATEALVERIFSSTVGLFDLAAVYLGDRLGFYRALAVDGAATSTELAQRTGTDERYVREWLEQQAVTDILAVDDETAAAGNRRYSLRPGHEEALVEPDSATFIAPLGRQALGMLTPLPRLVDAFRTGEGIPYAEYGEDTRQGIADLNRAMFLNELGSTWLPTVTDVHERLRDGARVADLGCGMGWSSIAIARAYPKVVVDGLDSDRASIEAARANASAEGLEHRVRFLAQDASDPSLAGDYAVVTIFEALHDMGRPVEALAHARALLAPDGVVIVADERVADRFTAPGDDLERIMYGFSVVHCLAVARADHEDSAATGTAMRPDTLREYARAAGFSRTEILPIENDFWRFYRLSP
jgi:2-polyprenyl-3-methyl-5-hydroxy-6-metoxy-1,4-benzoquinol methylase